MKKKKNLSASSSSTTTTSPSSSSLLSSSSSTFSSSSLSFDPTIMCSSKKATAGCLTGILRRILCSRGLPTHPSDQITDQNQNHPQFMNNPNHKNKLLTSSSSYSSSATTATMTLSSSPGIVARLMGLESMVENIIPTESSSVTLSRSRSMNSVECCDRMQGMMIHRRVKSTLSYRDVPDFLLLESDNFLVLSFEAELGSAKSNQRQRKMKENRREKVSRSDDDMVERKKEQSRKVFDEMPLRRKNDGNGKMMLLREVTNTLPMCSSQNNKYADSETQEFEEVLKNGKNLERRRRRKKKKKKKKTSCNCNCNCSANNNNSKVECNSEDSSPVSVLDFDRQVPDSEADSLGAILSRRKLSPEAGNDQNFEVRFDGNLMVEQRNMNMKGNSSKRKEKQREEYMDIWDKACRKAEDELIESNQIWKQGDWESISEDFESQIFDHLLTDLIGQLVTLK